MWRYLVTGYVDPHCLVTTSHTYVLVEKHRMPGRIVTGNQPVSADCVTLLDNEIVHTQHMFYINLKSYMFRPSSGFTFQKYEKQVNVRTANCIDKCCINTTGIIHMKIPIKL